MPLYRVDKQKKVIVLSQSLKSLERESYISSRTLARAEHCQKCKAQIIQAFQKKKACRVIQRLIEQGYKLKNADKIKGFTGFYTINVKSREVISKVGLSTLQKIALQGNIKAKIALDKVYSLLDKGYRYKLID